MMEPVSKNLEMATKQIKITGRFDDIAFRDWIFHRSAVLGLDISSLTYGQSSIIFSASGHSVLLDAMEIACSLGPSDAMVEKIQATDLELERITHND
tara:strand:+ start:611 stop:901 length:291 start_codon:yes stop_codon:yes gene_type:complete